MRYLTLALALTLNGCCAPGFVAAMADYQTVVGPEYRAYVEADDSLTDEQKGNRLNMVDAADAAIREAQQ